MTRILPHASDVVGCTGPNMRSHEEGGRNYVPSAPERASIILEMLPNANQSRASLAPLP